MRVSCGAQYIRWQRELAREKETVITNHVKRESELVQLKSGAVRRKRNA